MAIPLIPMIQLAMVLIPLVQSGIQLVEELIKGKGTGPEKKAIVVESVKKAYGMAQAAGKVGKTLSGISPEMVGEVTDMMVDMSVDIMNRTGIFKHDEDPIIAQPKIDTP